MYKKRIDHVSVMAKEDYQNNKIEFARRVMIKTVALVSLSRIETMEVGFL